MAELKTFWNNPPVPNDSGLDGDTITGRGTDPLVDTGGENALQQIWSDPVPDIDGQETANSVSGLPLQPNRFEPRDQPPPIPDLKDRNPGTIDER